MDVVEDLGREAINERSTIGAQNNAVQPQEIAARPNKPRRRARSTADVTAQGPESVQNGTEQPQEPAELIEEASNAQKRRGRQRRTEPAAEPRDVIPQTTSEIETGAPEGEEAKPARRGRTRRADPEAVAQAVEHPAPETLKPGRRGRPRKAEHSVEVRADEPIAVVGAPEADTPKPARRGRPRRTETAPEQPQAVAAQETSVLEANQPKRRGRPRRVETVAPEPVQEPLGAPEVVASISEAGEQEKSEGAAPVVVEPKRRGRPRKATPPAAVRAAKPETNNTVLTGAPDGAIAVLEQVVGEEVSSAPNGSYDPSLERLMQLWPSLHAQGRRAVVLYASTLVFEEIGDQ